jgi:hypothetical protein
MLRESGISSPVVMETHGGYGEVYRRCYSGFESGIVFEKDPAKSSVLARQRPTWRVYECDCRKALESGIGADLLVNVLDCDPYGNPWEILDAFFSHERERVPVLLVVVNDGTRQLLKANGAWKVKAFEGMLGRFENNSFYSEYLTVCRALMEEKAAKAGYAVDRFLGYYCGWAKNMTHYAAFLKSSLR